MLEQRPERITRARTTGSSDPHVDIPKPSESLRSPIGRIGVRSGQPDMHMLITPENFANKPEQACINVVAGSDVAVRLVKQNLSPTLAQNIQDHSEAYVDNILIDTYRQIDVFVASQTAGHPSNSGAREGASASTAYFDRGDWVHIITQGDITSLVVSNGKAHVISDGRKPAIDNEKKLGEKSGKPHAEGRKLTKDDRYLINLTIGIWQLVKIDDIVQLVATSKNPQEIADRLFEVVQDHDPENETVVVTELQLERPVVAPPTSKRRSGRGIRVAGAAVAVVGMLALGRLGYAKRGQIGETASNTRDAIWGNNQPALIYKIDPGVTSVAKQGLICVLSASAETKINGKPISSLPITVPEIPNSVFLGETNAGEVDIYDTSGTKCAADTEKNKQYFIKQIRRNFPANIPFTEPPTIPLPAKEAE